MQDQPILQPVDVSRETGEKLSAFASLVRKWSPAINLVSKSDLPYIETRHIADSLQLSDYIPRSGGIWADFGSGGGFPGIVTAIVAAEKAPDLRFHLVESDQRKSTFLRTAARELALNVTVHSERIETLAPLAADIISARALAPLDTLLGYAARHLSANGRCLFLKGQMHESEIETAREHWRFDCDSRVSRTDPDARLLRVSHLHHA
ncbi:MULTISPECIES: 16S rRNA (guanine(527)-N(7))-methyltransferase RsmG [Paracoccaceae]|uniref:16S rRNA (guanine(527)-N(7))-methyltransferase RsmG n=1 Tax=Paracoccaceae TaxID=31989 RepID=UPI00405A3581